ncbi:MAG TPA: hypothetical protein ENK84_08895, partial [Desulfobulbus sp.]|nr:hypothetical protein [Desulfobulbus sp.]
NPADYNGMKSAHHGARPVSGDSGLTKIAARAANNDWWQKLSTPPRLQEGKLTKIAEKNNNINHLPLCIDIGKLTPMTLEVNSGNGCAYPVSGEINSRVSAPDAVLTRITARYQDGSQNFIDELSVEYPTWRFNLRRSNTKPVIRLNEETRADKELLKQKSDELLEQIRNS